MSSITSRLPVHRRNDTRGRGRRTTVRRRSPRDPHRAVRSGSRSEWSQRANRGSAPTRVELASFARAALGLHRGDPGDQILGAREDGLSSGAVGAAGALERDVVAQQVDLVVRQAGRLEQRAEHHLVVRGHLDLGLIAVAEREPCDLELGRVLGRDRSPRQWAVSARSAAVSSHGLPVTAATCSWIARIWSASGGRGCPGRRASRGSAGCRGGGPPFGRGRSRT